MGKLQTSLEKVDIMAVNNNGNLLDSAGEVAIDFVWGNFPIQPNDARPDTSTGRLDPALDNHIIALSGWNGYPQYTPNTAGEDVAGATDYVLVPEVRGFTTALAQDAMKDASLTVTTATAATNARTDITRFDATSATVAYIFATNAHTNYPTGTKVTLVAGTPAGESPVNLPAYAIGTWTVTGSAASGQITVSGSGFTVANTTGINATATLGGTAGTIRVQSIAAGANQIAPAAAVTITPWATAS
jgi:hypothetical protein